MTGNEFWQWKNGSFLSDLHETEEEALYWAERATTGGSDDDIAVRSLYAAPWREVIPGGYADLQYVNDTGFEPGDIVERDFAGEKSVGRVEVINRYGLQVSQFGTDYRTHWVPGLCRLLSRPGSD